VPQNAVLVVDAARATIQNTRIVDSGGPGVWAQCTGGCDCAARPNVALSGVELVNTAFVGVSLHGVDAQLARVVVRSPRAADFQYGGGIVAAACSDVVAHGVTVDDADAFGLLVDNAKGSFGGMGDDKGIIIVNNRGGGVWLQNVVDGLTLENATITGNAVSGIDIGGGSRGIIIVNNRVGDTLTASYQAIGYVGAGGTPVPTGAKSIGDGVIWGQDAEVRITGLILGGSGRNAFLIDGAVAPGCSIAQVTLEAGDDDKGIIQQRASQASEMPETVDAPEVQQTVESPHDVPVAPLPPEALGP
jgi:hypothetical protein